MDKESLRSLSLGTASRAAFKTAIIPESALAADSPLTCQNTASTDATKLRPRFIFYLLQAIYNPSYRQLRGNMGVIRGVPCSGSGGPCPPD
jgi:hypothetical protein